MNEPHNHEYWRQSGGAMECACGDSLRTEQLTFEQQQAEIDRFGIFDEDAN